MEENKGKVKISDELLEKVSGGTGDPYDKIPDSVLCPKCNSNKFLIWQGEDEYLCYDCMITFDA